eukprot:TRINITY_DN9660_c0_g1_i1.p1 TRINITY_DN9660_c0_g1~~TRINITY_DN9660_c0_g1_i1.p1  ORF type:complete len:590 (+),score=131.20 TRINITY_DN9660_c0_g1_i1:92-1861(+)
MGQCVDKQHPTEIAHTLAAASSPEQAVSLSEASRRSSNAAITSAKYQLVSKRSLHRDYDVESKVLGQGLCGDVVLARSKVDGRPYALKIIRKTQLSASKLKQMANEVEIYLGLDHPNIARLHDVYESTNEIALLTECCQGGELYLRLQKRGVYTNADAAEATRQMLRAVGYLHANNVVHRDLKLENFLYESEDPQAQLKLIDFGFAKLWDPSTLMMASCGSIAYVSPDVLKRTGYTNKCDLWSLGVIVWMLLVGYPPFHGEEAAMLQRIKAGQPDWSHKSRWAPVSKEAVSFVQQLLTLDPCRRLDAKNALKHPWLRASSTLQFSQTTGLRSDILLSLQRYAAASKVRRAVLQLLAQELAPEETQDLRDLFLSIDKSNEGTISMRDLKEAIRNSGAQRKRNVLNPKDLAVSLCRADDDISPCSLGSRSPTGISDCSPVSRCSSGSPSPLMAARRLRRAPTVAIAELFDLLDANGNEKIYYSDFLAATLEARNSLRDEAVRAAFSRLDINANGQVTAENLKAVIGDSFEGVRVEDLVGELELNGRESIGYEEFRRVLKEGKLLPSIPSYEGNNGCLHKDTAEVSASVGGG